MVVFSAGALWIPLLPYQPRHGIASSLTTRASLFLDAAICRHVFANSDDQSAAANTRWASASSSSSVVIAASLSAAPGSSPKRRDACRSTRARAAAGGPSDWADE